MTRLAESSYFRFFPAATQILLVASTAIITFGYPIFFGLHSYGVFSATAALAFIIHKAIDLNIETMISKGTIFDFAKFSSVIYFAIFLFAWIIADSGTGVVHMPLLGSLLISTIVLNSIFKSRNYLRQTIFAFSFLCVTLVISVIGIVTDIFEIVWLIILINIIGAFCGIVIFREDLFANRGRASDPPGSGLNSYLARSVVDFVYRLSYSSFNLLIGFGVILIVRDSMDSTEVGALRLFSSIALLGFVMTPINPKMYYDLTRDTASPRDLLIILRPYLDALGAALFIWGVGVFVIGLRLVPVDLGGVELALATYPAVLFLSALDKVILNQRGLRSAGLFVAAFSGVSAIFLAQANTLSAVFLIMAGAILLYPIVAAVLFLRPFLIFAIPLSLVGGCAVLFMTTGMAHWPVLVFGAIALLTFGGHLKYGKVML